MWNKFFRFLTAGQRIRIWNEAYQKGLEDGVKQAMNLANESSKMVVEKWDGQFEFMTRTSLEDPQLRKHDVPISEIPVTRTHSRIFHARSVVGTFMIIPRHEAYATIWNDKTEDL